LLRRASFLPTGNSEALDLICTRYECGSPTQYLRSVNSLIDVAIDYSMARYHRQREVDDTMEQFQLSIKGLGNKPDASQVAAVALQWLVEIMSSK